MTDQLAVPSNSFLAPVVDIQGALARYNAFKEFVSRVLEKDRDYGEIPGTNKPTLLKPGAEKLSAFFGIRPVFVLQESVNDWTGKDHGGEPFFFREYKCQGFRNGEIVGEGVGSCNSWEKKYRYRWVNEMEVPASVDKSRLEFVDGTISEFEFAVKKGETSGKYGKPDSYWQQFRDAVTNGTAKSIMKKTKSGEMAAWEIGGKLYAVPNHDPSDQVNTIDKMAQKRALVAMVLIATNASDYFTQDMEDFVPERTQEPLEGHFEESKAETKQTKEIDPSAKFNYLNSKVVAMFAEKRGLSVQDAAAAVSELLKQGKISKEMTMDEFEKVAEINGVDDQFKQSIGREVNKIKTYPSDFS
jgi:hypothetical protein